MWVFVSNMNIQTNKYANNTPYIPQNHALSCRRWLTSVQMNIRIQSQNTSPYKPDTANNLQTYCMRTLFPLV